MKTHILAIVPYNGMKEMMLEIAAARNDIALTVYVNHSPQSELEIVRSINLNDYDVIVARGGTAKVLEKNVNLPVAKIKITIDDILRVIKLAENSTNRFAIVGIASIEENVKLLCSLLNQDIKVVQLKTTDDDRQALLKLMDEGYEMVLCDMRTSQLAYELGMNHILITSGRRSIEDAFSQAINITTRYREYRWQSKLFKECLAGSKETVFLYDSQHHLLYSTLTKTESTENIFKIVENKLDLFYENPFCRTDEQCGNFLYSFYCHQTIINEESCFFIYLTRQNVPISSEEGLYYYEKKELSVTKPDFWANSNLIGASRKMLEPYAKTLLPILILGEVGTGKEECASFIHRHSDYRNYPIFVIDCINTNVKKWNYFMESANSPLNELHITIYLKNMQVLQETLASKILTFIVQNDLYRRNRFLFSYTLTSSSEDNFVCQYIKNSLNSMVLRLPPLRERREEIPNIATLYINQTNIELGKQIISFSEDSMSYIQNFDWNQNLPQLRRVIRQLVVLTDGDYISADMVKRILKEETPKSVSKSKPGYEIINTNQTLNDIIYDVIRLVLEQEGMNRTKAASQLGISRSTLWRLLQR